MLEKVHIPHSYFINPIHPIKIALVGLGGTGSKVIGRLAQINALLQEIDHPGLHVMAYDHDKVEEHSIIRQSGFGYSDAGKNKAVVLVSKVNLHYGLFWDAVPRKFDPVKDIFIGDQTPNIILSCTDSGAFRNKAYKSLKESKQPKGVGKENLLYYWIDCGNAKNYGQVVASTVYKTDYKLKNILLKFVSTLKYPQDKFGMFNEKKSKASCSAIEAVTSQDFFVNDWAALLACELVKDIVFNKMLNKQGYFFNIPESTILPIEL